MSTHITLIDEGYKMDEGRRVSTVWSYVSFTLEPSQVFYLPFTAEHSKGPLTTYSHLLAENGET